MGNYHLSTLLRFSLDKKFKPARLSRSRRWLCLGNGLPRSWRLSFSLTNLLLSCARHRFKSGMVCLTFVILRNRLWSQRLFDDVALILCACLKFFDVACNNQCKVWPENTLTSSCLPLSFRIELLVAVHEIAYLSLHEIHAINSCISSYLYNHTFWASYLYLFAHISDFWQGSIISGLSSNSISHVIMGSWRCCT